jgi:hypothetical protein
MNYLLKDQELELKYQPGKGAFTYHLELPNTSHIKGRWGFLKASGTIDAYPIQSKNLFTITGRDKMLAINSEIRKAIGKTGGDRVIVTLYLDSQTPSEKAEEMQILASFQDAGVLSAFEKLDQEVQAEVVHAILSQTDEDKQVRLILTWIEKLGR